MIEDLHRTGAAAGDEVAPRSWTGVPQRIEARLPAERVPTEPSADALSSHPVESPRSSPHIVVTSVDPRTAQQFDEPAELLEVREHIGPFPDRRAAERWARDHYADKPSVTWTTAHVRGPGWVEEDVRRLRTPVGPPPA